MAIGKDVQKRMEDKAQRALQRGQDRLRKLGVLATVPRDLQRKEAQDMMANPALISAKVQTLAQSMPLERAQLMVAEQLLKE